MSDIAETTSLWCSLVQNTKLQSVKNESDRVSTALEHSKITRNLVIVLLLSSVLTVGLIPNVSSQQFTTSTSFLTSSLTQITTYYVTTFTGLTTAGIQTITASASFEPLQGACSIGLVTFTAATGPTHFEYSANGPMMLYVVNETTLMMWSSSMFGGNCAPTFGNWTSYKLSSQSYPVTGSFDLSLPSLGNPYAAVFVAPASASPAATLTVGPVLALQTKSMTASILVTIPSSVTTTLIFATTLAGPSTQTYSDWIVGVVFAIIILGLLLFERRIRKSSKSSS